MFVRVWTGCKCPGGETWHVAYHQECDVDNDKVYSIPYCTRCLSDRIEIKKDKEGNEIWHALTHDELLAEIMAQDEDDFELF